MNAMSFEQTPVKPKQFIKRKYAARQMTLGQFKDVEKLGSYRALCYAGKIMKMVYKRHEVGVLQVAVAAIFVVAIVRHF